MTKSTRTIAIATITLFAGITGGSLITSYNDAQVDITIMPCSAWAHEARPMIPAYTFTGGCMLPDGTIDTP